MKEPPLTLVSLLRMEAIALREARECDDNRQRRNAQWYFGRASAFRDLAKRLEKEQRSQ